MNPVPAIDTPDAQIVGAMVAQACAAVEKRVASALASELPPVQTLCRHLEHYHGKMVRPALVFMAGMATQAPRPPQATDALVTLAGVCEMVHLATLVHDDVLDEADVRRKAQTVNRLTGNEAAVILGDYVFSAAFALCSTLGDAETSKAIGRTGMTLCAGELVQLHHRRNLSLDEATYYELVKGKTASLISISASLGCRHAGGTDQQQARFASFGEKLGVAFQIQDDLLDIAGDQRAVGKNLGRDMAKGKLTLPVIHHLSAATPAVRGRTLLLLEAAGESAAEPDTRLLTALQSTGSIDHARAAARRLVAEAKAELAHLPESGARQVLMSMADSVVDRSC